MISPWSLCGEKILVTQVGEPFVLTARRGWVEPRHVLNTLPLAGFRDALARKRR